MTVEVVLSGRNVLTPHGEECYPGLRVIRPGRWDLSLIVPGVGDTIVALGGETVYAYETVDGGRAQGFSLRRGDRATLVSRDREHCFSEWHIERG